MTATQTQNLEIAPMPGPQGQAPAGPGSADRRRDLAAALRPLLVDVGIPVGTYYLLRNAFGVSLWLSLALSSIGPAVRAIAGLVTDRKLNLLAVLMLAVNLAGIAVSFLTGDPRAMIAKDSIVSSVIAFTILGSVLLRRPLMSAGLRPFMTRGEPRRTAAWDRLSTASPRFRRLELLSSTIWGLALLADCAARLVGAYTLALISDTAVPIDHARAHLLYGEWLRRQGRRTDAREELRTAYSLFSAMGATAYAERARSELAAADEQARQQLPADPQLTAQEAQIARLAAASATNQEITSQLFLSVNTVEYHLKKVFRKLGITSRRKLKDAINPQTALSEG